MDQVHVIRHKVLVEKRSQRSVAREMGVSRNTVAKYLAQPTPSYGPRKPRVSMLRERVRPHLEALLAESQKWTQGKQRLTAPRIKQLLEEKGLKVGLSTIKEMVAEHRRKRREVFVPLVYTPGDLAEVDFFEVFVDVGECRRKAWLFLMRLMHSGRDFAWLYGQQDQVSFLDGHVRAFEHFGAVPNRIAYDNLRAAVSKVLIGSERELAARFSALSSHYLFESSFCRPRTGHDKGGVEARGKGIRWQELVPIPRGETLDAISAALLARLDERMQKRPKDSEASSIGERFAIEREKMLGLPVHRFQCARTLTTTVDSRSLVQIDGALYSTPTQWARLEVTVLIGASEVEILPPRMLTTPGGCEVSTMRIESARHPRLRGRQRSIDYRHYVVELARKPQALRQVASELMRDLGEPFVSAWHATVDAHGPKEAARLFAKVLGYVEVRGVRAVAATIEEALRQGEPLLLALAPSPRVEPALGAELLPTSLREMQVESGCAADYDVLLGGGAR
jgi:transposase